MDEARRRTRRRLITAAFSVAGHLALVLGLLSVQADAPRVVEPEPMVVQLVQAPPAPEPAKADPAPAAAPKPEPEKPTPPRRAVVRPTPPPPPEVTPRLVREARVETTQSDGDDELSDAQLAGAATAGSGGEGSGSGGGDCDMTRRLQSALRRDARVQAAVAEAHRGKAIMVWNGDWVRHGGQEGQGMAAVREAILWEVGFAPKACRAEPMHGLVLISLNDGPGAARLVVGSDQWRWSDILFRRGGERR